MSETKPTVKRAVRYFAGKPTGSYFCSDGSPEYGNTCGHEHRSYEAAERCAARQEAPGFGEWRVDAYSDDDLDFRRQLRTNSRAARRQAGARQAQEATS